MKTISKVGLGALVLVMGASLLAMRPHVTNGGTRSSLPPTSNSLRFQRNRDATSIIVCSTRASSSWFRNRPWSASRSASSRTAGSPSSRAMARQKRDQAIRSRPKPCSAGRPARRALPRRWSPSSPKRARSTLAPRSPIMRRTSDFRTETSDLRPSETSFRTASVFIVTPTTTSSRRARTRAS